MQIKSWIDTYFVNQTTQWSMLKIKQNIQTSNPTVTV
jgi:hypothetical protein